MSLVNKSNMIREYEDKDLAELLDAWYSASMVAHPFLSEEFFEQERENIVSIHLPNAETWVYELDVIVIGFIALIENEVGAIFLDPKFHGRGIGRALMDHARSIREVLELDVAKDNKIGRNFYKKYGFIEQYEHMHKEYGFMQLRLKLIC